MLVCAAADTKRFDIGGAAHGADRVRPLFSFSSMIRPRLFDRALLGNLIDNAIKYTAGPAVSPSPPAGMASPV